MEACWHPRFGLRCIMNAVSILHVDMHCIGEAITGVVAYHAASSILQQFANIRQGLVQRAAIGRSRLNRGARAPWPRNQPFGLHTAQGFTQGEAADAEPFAQRGFCRELLAACKVAREDSLAQGGCQLQVARGSFDMNCVRFRD